jgi:hypothetical protein
VRRYSPRLQKIIGYTVAMPWLGWVDFDDPRNMLLDGSQEKERIDFY